MGRIRSIKPELNAQARVGGLSDAAYRLYIGCLSLADDAGNLPAGPSYLGGQIFYAHSRSPKVIGRLIGELEAARLVDRYTVDGASYLSIVGWSEKGCPAYQRIDKPQAPQCPRPSSVRSWNEFAERSQTDPIRSETIRNEGIARAREGAHGNAASPRPHTGSAVLLFTRKHRKRTGAEPTWTPALTKKFDQLIALHGEEQVLRHVRIFFDYERRFPPEHDLATFVAHFDKFATAPTNGRADISNADYTTPSPHFPDMLVIGPDGEVIKPGHKADDEEDFGGF